MDKLVEVLGFYPQSMEIKKNIVWIISNLVQLKPLTGEPWEELQKGFPLLKAVFAEGQTSDALVLVHAIKAVSYLIGSFIIE